MFASEHGLGAGFVLLELQVLVDGEGMGHGLYVKVVGTDEREGPTLLLQLDLKTVAKVVVSIDNKHHI